MSLRLRFLLLLLLTTTLAVAMGVAAVFALRRVDRLERESLRIHEQQLSTQALHDLFRDSCQRIGACLRGDPDARELFEQLQVEITGRLDSLIEETDEPSAREALHALVGDHQNLRRTTDRYLFKMREDQDEHAQDLFRNWVENRFTPELEADVRAVLDIYRQRREEDSRGVHEAVQRTLYALLLGFLLLAGTALFGLGLLRRWLLRPIQALEGATRDIGRGRFTGSIPIQGHDELGRLARHIEDMHHDLQQSQELLVRREQFAAMGEMTASVAHNLRNPLAAIRLTTQNAMLELGEEHDAWPLLRSVKETVDRMDRWLRTTLTSLRPIPLQPVPTDPRPMIVDLVDAARVHATRRGIRLPSFVSDDLPPILADRNKLDQALLAILFNAMEASPDGEEVTVCGRLDRASGRVQIEFRDHGPGMDERVRTKLFTPFFTTKETGTGIGLYLAHRIILEHQGEIRVESQPGAGTCMTVCLATETPRGR